MRKSYVAICMCCFTGLSAQIGINTPNPQASLDIAGTNKNGGVGLLVPRLTSTEILAMSQNVLGTQHHSLIMFATDAAQTGDFVTSKITQPGFYRYTYDGGGAFQQYWRKMEPTAFERIIQNGKSGIRLIDADNQKYGLIGHNAVDASFSNQTTSTNGATGDNSFAVGLNTISRGIASTAVGNGTEAGGNGSFAGGGQKTRSVGNNSFAYGEDVHATQDNSVAFGKTNTSQGINSSILAGRNNRVTNSFNSAILSGNNNTINFTGTSIDAFPNNYRGVANNILGGNANNISGSASSSTNTIIGGTNNLINEGRSSTIGGGGGNRIRPDVAPYDYAWYDYNVIAGGGGNEINADKSVIGGGDRNLIRLEGTSTYPQGAGMSTISGGQFNKIINNAHFSAVVGGRGNSAKGSYSIVGGASNAAQSVAEISLGLFGTLYTPQYPNAYTFNGTWINDLALSKDRLFNIGNGKAPSNFDFAADLVNGMPQATRSDAFTVLKNGQVGIDMDNFETNTSTAKLQVNGGVKIGAQSSALSGNTCDNTNRGQIIFVEDNFYGCKSTGWVLLNN